MTIVWLLLFAWIGRQMSFRSVGTDRAYKLINVQQRPLERLALWRRSSPAIGSVGRRCRWPRKQWCHSSMIPQPGCGHGCVSFSRAHIRPSLKQHGGKATKTSFAMRPSGQQRSTRSSGTACSNSWPSLRSRLATEHFWAVQPWTTKNSRWPPIIRNSSVGCRSLGCSLPW